jgi:hypothetical protein
MARKSKPWAVILSTPGGPIRTEHRSQPETYRKVNAERELIKSGASRVTRIRVEQWEADASRWTWYEDAYPED